jgi:hypothetical protein
VRGYGGIYTPFHRKLANGERVPGYSGYMFGYSRHSDSDTPDSEQFTDGEHLPRDSGILWTSLSGYSEPGPGHSGFSREFHKKAVYSGRFDS